MDFTFDDMYGKFWAIFLNLLGAPMILKRKKSISRD